MSACAKCGGSLSNPFDFSSVESTTCQCNTGGLVITSDPLPNQTCCVVSVNDKVGKVNLTIEDIPLGDNQFLTPALVVASLTPTPPISMDSTGVFTHDDTAVTPGTYGTDAEIPVITVDAKGHITNATTVPMATPAVGDDLTAIEALTGTGYLIRTDADTWALKSIEGTAGQIQVNDGDGVDAPTTIELIPTGVIAGDYGGANSWPVLTLDELGRVIAASTTALPAPTIPEHTHALTDLSNVDPTITSPTTGDVLTWDGTKWTTSSAGITIERETVTCEAILKVATSGNDIDISDAGSPINTVYKFKDINNRYKVSINAVFYILESDLTGFPVSDITDLFIGTLPAGYEPVHPTYISGVNLVTPLQGDLKSFDSSVDFAGVTKIAAVTFMIDTDGKIYLSLFGSSNYSACTLSGVDNVILPLTAEFLTKLIVP